MIVPLASQRSEGVGAEREGLVAVGVAEGWPWVSLDKVPAGMWMKALQERIHLIVPNLFHPALKLWRRHQHSSTATQQHSSTAALRLT